MVDLLLGGNGRGGSGYGKSTFVAMQRSEAERALLATYDLRRVLTDLAAGDKHCAMFSGKGGELGDDGEG